MLGNLPNLPKSKPRPTGDRRRAATWQKAPTILDGDPSDSASTLTRENAALLAQSLCSARGVTGTRIPGSVAPSPRVAATPPSLASIFGATALSSATPTVTPVRLEDRFAACAPAHVQ